MAVRLAGLSTNRHGFDTRPVRMGILVGEVEPKQVFLRLLLFLLSVILYQRSISMFDSSTIEAA